MKDISKIYSTLLFAGGLGIIIAAYFLFLKECQSKDLFYLNMIATCLVFAIVYLRSFDIFGSVEQVAQSGSGYGLSWYGIRLYTPLALALIVLSILFEWSFNFCLIGHLVLLFILLVLFFLGFIVKNNVNEAEGNIEARKAGLKEIASQIDMLEIQCKLGNGAFYLDSVGELREHLRFITASDKPVAIALENKLIEKIRLISSQVEHNSQTTDVINEELNECRKIMELRKNQY